MIRLIYNLLFPIGLLVFLPAYIMKMFRRGNYRHKFAQRFGIYDSATRARLRGGGRTWIHAVSVGEVVIALKLAAKLRELDANFRCLLTTTTTTGFALAQTSASEWLGVTYHPLDFWPIVRRAFRVIQPTRLVLVEAEVWPNLVAIARRRGMPISLVNARLSARSEGRFRKFRRFVAPTFRCLDLVCVQEAADVERWSALGVPRNRVRHVGSIKLDPVEAGPSDHSAAEALRGFGIGANRPVLFGGSTHAGEEEVLATAWQRLRADFPLLVLVIVPRHVERSREIRTRFSQLGIDVALRTEAAQFRTAPPDCILLDTTGELRNWYRIATVVFIGKSLTARGGQNPVEPIVAGKPVMFGPHMENFASLAAALVKSGGAVEISDADSLVRAAARLLRDPEAAAHMVANARAAIAPHSGATVRTASMLLTLQTARH
jgi:3-deoxy-D-manno-octulosonic-acid transferase